MIIFFRVTLSVLIKCSAVEREGRSKLPFAAFRFLPVSNPDLKGRPWEFNFEVKFYPPDPATLTDDLTRYYLTLQIRHDIYTGRQALRCFFCRLPATLATHALLGSYVAQAERGDFQDTPGYDDFLRDCRLAPVPSSTLYEKIRELHKQHKGETPSEAESHYLDNAKKLSMYGVFLFPAKDSKGVPVQVGVCAHGINIYCDQIRIHRFIWQNIIKIAYRRNTFTIKLQPGELDKNASLFVLKVPDFASAKRIWKCAVEHHTFFRLIQPDEKPHKGLFRWGSGRFRYQGRTHFQSKMASQMFDHPTAAVKRSHSARMASRSDENLAQEATKQHTSPLHYADDGTSRDLTSTPEKSYTLHSTDVSEKKDKGMKRVAKANEAEVGECRGAIFDGSAALVHDDSRSPPAASFGHTTYSSSLRFSPHSRTETRAQYGGTPHEQPTISANGQHENPVFERSQPLQNGPDISELHKEGDLRFDPLHDTVVVYHPGHYEEISRNGGPMREPPIEAGDDVVFIPHSSWKLKDRSARPAAADSADTDLGLLNKQNELDSWPIKYFVSVYHSGFEKYCGGNRGISNFERVSWEGAEEVVNNKDVDKSKYPSKSDVVVEPVMRMERCIELPAAPLKAHSSVYHCGYSCPVADVDGSPKARHRAGKWLCSDIIKTGGASQRSKAAQSKLLDGTREMQSSSFDHKFASHAVEEGGIRTGSQPHRSFVYAMHPGEVEVIEKSDVRPETYGLPSTSYSGPLENVSRATEISSTPIGDHASIYHSGVSVSKFRKVRADLKGKEGYSSSSSELSEEENREEGGDKRKKKALLYLRDSRVKTSEKATEGASWRLGERGKGLFGRERDVLGSGGNLRNTVPSNTHDAAEGDALELLLAKTKEYDSDKLQIPQYRLFGRVCHEGEVEVVEKGDVKLETYGLPSTSYEGPLLNTVRDEELSMTPIRNHSSVYHCGMSSVKTRRRGMQKLGFSAQGRENGSFSAESSDAEDSKQRAASESDQFQRGEGKSSERGAGLFSFWRSPGRRPKGVDEQRESSRNVGAYPTITSQAYTGSVDTTDRSVEVESAPLRAKVSVCSSEQIGLPATWTDYRSFDRVMHEGDVDFVEKSNVKPQSYGVSYEPYDGPFEKTAPQRELIFLPLREHSAKYHSGQSWSPAVHTVATNEDGIRERSPDEKNKDRASGVFSFWRMSGQSKNRSTATVGRGDPVVTAPAYTGHVDNIAYGKDIPREPLITDVARESAERATQERNRDEIIKSKETTSLLPISYEEHLRSLEKEKELASVPLRDHTTVYSSRQQDIGYSDKAGRIIADESKGNASYRSLGQSPERKLKSTEGGGHVVPGGIDYPVITSHAYSGPLQSVFRSRDIPSEPLHTAVTVYSSDQPKQPERRQRYRTFHHVVHKGDIEVIAKSDVQPDSYKLSTSPYQGPLENTCRDEELAATPLHDYSSVYHSGISFAAFRKPKFGFGFKRTKNDGGSSTESSSGEEVVSKETAEHVVSIERPLNEKIKGDYGGHFSFWRPHGWRTKTYDDTSGPDTSAEYPVPLTKAYAGPIDSTDRSEDMTTQPLNIQIKAEKENKPRLRHRLKDYRLFMRRHHDGEVEFIEKVNVKPESYSLSSIPYSGVLEQTKRDEDLRSVPLSEYASVYHSGVSVVKGKKPKLPFARIALTKTAGEETSSESSSEEDTDEGKKSGGGWFSFLHSSDSKPKAGEVLQPKAGKGYREITFTSHSGPVHDTGRTEEMKTGLWGARVEPAETKVKRPRLRERLGDYRLFRRVGHYGEIETVEKCDVIPESYRLPLGPYEGTLDSMCREEELSSVPIRDYASIYHPGLSYVKVRKKKFAAVAEKVRDQNESSSESSSEGSDGESKKKAQLMMKEEVPNGEKIKGGRGGLFTFWRSSDRKNKGIESGAAGDDAYPKQTAEACTGPIDDTAKQEEMRAEPWVTTTTSMSQKAKPKLRQRLGDYRLFGRLTYGGETETVDKKDVNPESYKLSPVPYYGVLLSESPTKDLEFAPIRDFSSVYHSGRSYVKPKKMKLAKWDIGLRKSQEDSSSESSNDESMSKNEAVAKDAREGGNGLFSFWHSSVHRAKEGEIPQKGAVKGIYSTVTQESYAKRAESAVKTKEAESEKREIEAKAPLPERPKLRDRLPDYRLFGRVFCGGEEDTVNKNDVDPESYKVSSTPYAGDLEKIRKEEELLSAPIHDYSSVYHSGRSYVKMKRVSAAERDTASKESKVDGSSSESSSDEDISSSKREAQLREREPLDDTGKADRGGLFSFWRLSERRAKGGEAETGRYSTEHYPTISSHPCSGPIHDTKKTDELRAEPWQVETDAVRVKRPKFRERLNDHHLFRRVTHGGETDVVEKKDVNPESYGVKTDRHEGFLLNIQRDDELRSAPIKEYSSVYHSGVSFVKMKRKEAPRVSTSAGESSESSSESSSNETAGEKQKGKEAKGAGRVFSFWRSAERKTKEDKTRPIPVKEIHQMIASASPSGLVSTTKKSEELLTEPLATMPKMHGILKPKLRERLINYRLFGRVIHEGDVDVIEKEHVRPEMYGLSVLPFEGKLESVDCEKDLSYAPLHEYSSVYHPGKSFVKPRKTKSAKVGLGFIRRKADDSSTESSSEKEIEEGKKKVLLHIRGASADDERKPDSGGGLFSFWRSSESNAKDASTAQKAARVSSAVASKGSTEPQKVKPETEHLGSGVHLPKRPRLKERLSDYHLFRRELIGGDTEFIEKQNVKLEAYKLSAEPYTGQLDCISRDNEMSSEPVHNHSSVYHPGTSYMKSKRVLPARIFFGKEKGSEEESESSDSGEREANKMGAIIHVKGAAAEDSKGKEGAGGIFSFWRSSERKPREQKGSEVLHGASPAAPSWGPIAGPVQEITRDSEISTVAVSTTKNHPKHPRLGERLNDYRLFGRVIHGGEVDVVDKADVRPESYRLSADPYNGKIEDTMLTEELPFVPIRDHSSVYHPGLSHVKVKKQSKQAKLLVEKGFDQFMSESSSESEGDIRADSTVKSSKAADDGIRDITSGLFSFWRSSDRKPKNVHDVQNALAVAEKQLPLTSIGSTSRAKEMTSQPLQFEITELRHTKPKKHERLRDYRLFLRAACPGNEEIVEKDRLKLESYKLSSAPYTDKLERDQPGEELQFCPIRDYSAVYHPGTSCVKSAQKTGEVRWDGKDEHPNIESASDSSSYESESERKKVGDRFFSFLRVPKRLAKESDVHAEPCSKTATDVGSIDETTKTAEFASEPLPVGVRSDRVKLRDRIGDYRLFGRLRHDGEESFVEKGAVVPGSYGLLTGQYHGPLETVTCVEELSFRPIRDYATVYHSGRSFVKRARKRPVKTEERPSEESSESSSGEDERFLPGPESSQNKNAEAKPGFFSFLRSSDRKPKADSAKPDRVTTSNVALCLPAQQVHNRPEDTINRFGEIEYEPLRIKVDVYHSGLPQTKNGSRARTFVYATHEGEVEMVEKTDIKPETYGISFARYQGPLSTIEKEQELPSASIRQYTSIYHPGHSYVKSRRLLPLSSFGKKEDLASGASSDEEEKGDEIKKSSKHPTENTKASGSRAEKVGKFPFWRPGAHKSKDRDEGVDSVRKMEFAVERITDDSTSVPKVYILDQTEEMRSCPSSYCNVEIIRKEDVKPETYKIDYSAYQGPLESIKHADELPSTPIRDFSSVYHPGKYEFSETRPVIEGELKEVPSAHTQEEKSEKAQIAGGSSFISSLTGRKPWQPEDQQKSYGEAPVPSSTVSNDLVCTLPPSKEMNTEPFVESKKPDTSAHIHEVERSPGCNNYGDHLDNLSSQKELPAASLPQHASTYHPQFSHAENKDMKEIDGSSKVNEKSGGRFSFWKGRKLNGSDKEKEAAPCGPYSAEKIDRAQTLQESSFGPSNTIQNDKQAPEKSDDALGCQALGREIHVGEDEITEQADVKPETHSIYFCPDPVGKIDRDDELPTTAIGDFCSVYHPGEIVVEGGGGENRREAVKSEKDSRPARPEQSSGDRDSKRRPLESEAKEVKDSDKSARSEVLPSALHGPVDEISRTEEIASVPYHASAPAESPLGGVPTEGTSVYTFRRVTDYDSRTDSSDEYPSVIGRRIELSSIKSDLSTSRAARSANAPHTSTLFGRSNLAGVDPLTTVEGFTERMPSFYTLQTYVSDPYGSVKSGAGRSEKHGEEESRSDAGYLLNDSRVGAAADSREAVIAAVGESGVSELSPSSAMDETPRTLVGFIKRRITQVRILCLLAFCFMVVLSLFYCLLLWVFFFFCSHLLLA
ncbi:unnamed protein product [Toxocara canis]|uniref:FERM domain-containing protein n=1 Tax=Toxocara canis TaxID=6265 RepID=A0A3P7HX46_TOXCA|nr:unnamed protein product [Toxocara canis]